MEEILTGSERREMETAGMLSTGRKDYLKGLKGLSA